MNIAAEKAEIIRWIETVDNPAVLAQINRMRREKSFDFEKEWERSSSGEELKRRTRKYLETLPWKK